MGSGYMQDATSTVPVQFCPKCGTALGNAWSIEGGLNFHPWCAPSVTRHHGAWSTDCNKANLTIDQRDARIAELEDENQLVKDDFDRMQRECKHEKIRAEQAEAHAADCKRLVTSCEDDIDALRMKRRELETETARYEHLYEAERRVRIAMDKRAEQAEAEVARLRKLFGMAERGTE